MRQHLLLASAGFLLSAAFGASSLAQVTVTAVNLGGEFTGANTNSTLDDGAAVVTDTGDFNGDTVTDARWRIPMDHAGNFTSIGGSAFNGRWASGAEIINYGSTTPTGVNLFRLANSGAADTLQMTNAAGTGTSIGLVFAPHVRKANFLNSASVATTVSFTDSAGGFFIDYNWASGNANVSPNARQTRATVQNGSDWYISGTEGGALANGAATFNPHSETWYPWDVNTSLFFDTPSSGGVLGSTFTDIQALGTVMMLDSASNLAGNSINANFQGMSVSVDITLPPPPTAPIGKQLVYWSMDSVGAASKADPFGGGTWMGDAVPDGFDANDPLFLGDPLQGGTFTFDTAKAPELTTGGQGVLGEALRFNGSEQDEAVGIVAWPGDTSDPFVTEDLNSVYVNFYFKEDNNMNGAQQFLVGVRNTWDVKINANGQLEWTTFLQGGGSNTILSDPLGDEGEWRHVEAWHDVEGNKALFLNGELVGVSAPGSLLVDTASIVVGNRENQSRWFTGLIDEVYVGTGVPGPELLPGDYNADGVVDAADYTVWRDTLGSTTVLDADGNGDNVVDAADYDFWKARFGDTSGGAALASQASVPEPGTLALIGMAGLAMYGYGRKRFV